MRGERVETAFVKRSPSWMQADYTCVVTSVIP